MPEPVLKSEQICVVLATNTGSPSTSDYNLICATNGFIFCDFCAFLFTQLNNDGSPEIV